MSNIKICKILGASNSALLTAGWFALFLLATSNSHAASFSLQFNVTVQLSQEGATGAGLCRSRTNIGAFGETVTVICSSGEIVDFSGDKSALPWSTTQEGTFEYATISTGAGKSLTTLRSYAGGGTVTSWRVINLADRDYLELLVGW